ncbi:MAG: kelch repeat-containing protein [Cyclobacteriaceae bacterium]
MAAMPWLVSIFLMTQMMESCGQKNSVISVEWKAAGTLSGVVSNQSLGIAGPVAGVHNNVLIVGGGANFPESMPWAGGKKKYYSEIYTFKKDADTLIVQNEVFHLPVPMAYGANCSTSDGVIYAGGESETGLSNKVLLIRWNATTKKINITPLPDLPYGVTNASLVQLGNKIVLLGGETTEGTTSSVLALDILKPASIWQTLTPLPQPVSHAVAVAYTESKPTHIYVVGGRKKNNSGVSTIYSSVYRYNSDSGEWRIESPLPYAVCAGTGVVSENHILLFGGDKAETFNRVEKLIAAISTEQNESKKQELIQQKNKLQENHPGFGKEILAYNFGNDSWFPLGAIPYDVAVTTTAVKWGSEVIIPSGEIRAGVRTAQIWVGRVSSK